MQKQIKLLYDPYQNRIQFSISQDGGDSWDSVSENSDLRHYENQDCVLANCAEDIVFLINKYQNVSEEGVLIRFIGTAEDYDLLGTVIERENAKDPKRPKISRGHYARYLSADEAIEIIRAAYKRIASEFADYLPECDGFEDFDANSQSIGRTISKFNETVSTEIPVCIIGTYSIGKSALINAIVGAEILPSAVKQCTAKNVKVVNDKDYALFFNYNGEEVALAIRNGDFEPLERTEETDQLSTALHELIDFSRQDEASIIRSILRLLNGEITSGISGCFGFNVTVRVPFKDSILNCETARIVLYDTPGSDNSDVDQHAHREALEELMQDQTNALPVFVMDREHALSNDHQDVRMLIDSNKSGFSSPNCIIVFSKAERLTKSQFREEIPTTLINWHGGITFLHVCAIGALGAKKAKTGWSDPQYQEIYRDWYRKYAEDGKSLPQYNRVPCNRRMTEEVRATVSDELYASGVPSLEDEINYFVLRYANYKKCVNGRKLLLKAMNLAKKKLEDEEEHLRQEKQNKEDEQTRIRDQLLKKLRAVSPKTIDVYDLARKYDKILSDYCSTVYSAVETAWIAAKNRSDKKDYMNIVLQQHCKDNLFIPAYEGEDGIAHQITQRLIGYATDYISSLRQIVEERQDRLSDDARSELEAAFSSIGMPEFQAIDIKGPYGLLDLSVLLNISWLEEICLKSIAEDICTKLDIHEEGALFWKKKVYGVFQEQCIIKPVREYENQLKDWTGKNRSIIETTINRDNAILSQYDAEIAETELRIQDLKDRLARLDDVKRQLDGVLSVSEGVN